MRECRGLHRCAGYWLFASPNDDGTGTALKVCYSTAKHMPGCIAAAKKIEVSVHLRLIGDPPPRLAKLGQPYMLKDKHGDVERWLIPTESEELIRGAAERTAMMTLGTTATADPDGLAPAHAFASTRARGGRRDPRRYHAAWAGEHRSQGGGCN